MYSTSYIAIAISKNIKVSLKEFSVTVIFAMWLHRYVRIRSYIAS